MVECQQSRKLRVARNNSMKPRKEDLVGDVIADDTLCESGPETAEMKGVRKASSKVQSLWELVSSNGKFPLSR